MSFKTSDICDQFVDKIHHLQVADSVFKSFGGAQAFCGRVTTLKIFEDSVPLGEVLAEKVEDRVLVVDGGGSHRCALFGGDLSSLACDNGWSGIIVYGCIRDAVAMSKLPMGVLCRSELPHRQLSLRRRRRRRGR
jgi:regulator of ribonuclease activity A